MKTYNPKFWLVVAVLAALSGTVSAQTIISGFLSSNTTWTLAGSPYIITGNTLVNSGVSLIIEPGVVVKLDSAKTLQIDGELIAIGNAQSRITFTGNNPSSLIGWGKIQFGPTAISATFDSQGNYLAGSVLKYCDLMRGGGVDGESPYISYCRLSGGGIRVRITRVEHTSIRNGGILSFSGSTGTSDIIILNDTVEYSGGNAWSIQINATLSNVLIQNCVFTQTGNYDGISIPGSVSNLTIENCPFTRTDIAIDVADASNTTIRNCVFTSNNKAVQGTLGNTTISNNTFTGNTQSVLGEPGCDYHPFLGDYKVSTLNTGNIILVNNYFEDNKGVIYATATYCTIQGNTFFNNRYIPVSDCFWGPTCSGTPNGCWYMLVGILSNAFSINQGGLIVNNVFDGNTSTSTSGERNLLRVDGDWEIASNIFKNNSPCNIPFYGYIETCSNKFMNNAGSVLFSLGSTTDTVIIHHNEFLNNTGEGAVVSGIPLVNSEFVGNSSSGYPIVSFARLVHNNRFLNNISANYPLISGTGNIYNNEFFYNQHSGSSVISTTGSNCQIHYNNFQNNIATSCLKITTSSHLVNQNNFVNPSVQYEVENGLTYNTVNLNIQSNYWGTANTAHIDSVIKDFFDDGNVSIALYLPLLASPATVVIDTYASCFPDSITVSLSGAIITETGSPVAGVTVNLSGDYNQTLTTDNGGSYHFKVAERGSYAITPSKNNDSIATNGVTLVDILLMRRHALGITPLSSPYKVIAASEANEEGNTAVTSLDILVARSFIIGSITSFPNNRLWQFVSSDHIFPNPQHPFPFDKTRTYINMTTDQTSQNFIGIKLGDVNGSWDQNVP